MDRSRRVPAHDQNGLSQRWKTPISSHSFLVMTAAYSEGLFAPLKGGKEKGLPCSDLSSCHYLSDPHVLPAAIGLPYSLSSLSLPALFTTKAFLPFIGGGLGVLWIGWDRLSARHHVHLFHQGYIGRAASDVHGQCDLHD